jgi:hypothetical protein
MTQRLFLDKKMDQYPDLTMLRDPEKLWPDPNDAPDYPNDGHQSPYPIERARQVLKSISLELNCGRPVRRPSDEERETLLRKANARERAMIDRAAALRGYIRKLETRAAEAKRRKAERERERATRVLDNFREHVGNVAKERRELEKGFKRHLAFLRDKEAYTRMMFMRVELENAQRAAAEAARSLDRKPPELPEWAYDLPTE